MKEIAMFFIGCIAGVFVLALVIKLNGPVKPTVPLSFYDSTDYYLGSRPIDSVNVRGYVVTVYSNGQIITRK